MNTSSLLNDPTIRKIAEALLAIFIILDVLLALFVAVALVGKAISNEGWSDHAVSWAMSFLTFPVKSGIASLATALVAIFPVIIGIVCYKVTKDAENKNVASDKLSALGYTFLVCAIAVGLCAFAAIAVLHTDLPVVRKIFGEDGIREAGVKAALGSVLSFHILYVLKLARLEA